MNAFERGLRKLVLAQLSELLFCEGQLVHALDAMAKAAQRAELKELLLAHRQETKGHMERVIACFAELDEVPKAFPCRATQGLVEDGAWLIHTLKDEAAIDHALVGAAQRTEMFEIASYTNLIRMAELIGEAKVAQIARGILEEEKAANKKLAMVLHVERGI